MCLSRLVSCAFGSRRTVDSSLQAPTHRRVYLVSDRFLCGIAGMFGLPAALTSF